MTSDQSAESAADVLDRELANTKRDGIVTAASVAVAVTGGFYLMGGLQLWSAVWLASLYEYVPWGLVGFGVLFLFLGSRIYSQNLRALLQEPLAEEAMEAPLTRETPDVPAGPKEVVHELSASQPPRRAR